MLDQESRAPGVHAAEVAGCPQAGRGKNDCRGEEFRPSRSAEQELAAASGQPEVTGGPAQVGCMQAEGLPSCRGRASEDAELGEGVDEVLSSEGGGCSEVGSEQDADCPVGIARGCFNRTELLNQ